MLLLVSMKMPQKHWQPEDLTCLRIAGNMNAQ